MRARWALVLALIGLLLTHTPPAVAAPVANARWIVTLPSPALAIARPEEARLPGLARPTPAPRLAIDSPANAAYLTTLAAEQAAFARVLRDRIPSAVIERQYGVLVNAVAVRAPNSAIAALGRLPGVMAIAPDRPYRLQVDAVEQIGAPTLWQQVGGPDQAGQGVKIAVLDSGIYTPHPSFNPAGFRYPPGFPKGDTRFTTPKVIVARAYFRPTDPPRPGQDTPLPQPGADSHGTHVAAIAAGVSGVLATVNGAQLPISGVAPGAYLMNYRVFTVTQSDSDFASTNAFTVELIAAMEDAVRDGADIISNSWGASYTATEGWSDPMTRAVEAATRAGVIVVQATGNSGPASATTIDPANAAGVIAVGAVSAPNVVARERLIVTGPEAPPSVTRLRMTRAAFGARLVAASDPAPAVELPAPPSGAGCDPLPEGSLTGQVALILRGVCPFARKAINAQNAGAVAAIIINTTDDLFPLQGDQSARFITIPVAMIGRSDGRALGQYLATAGGAARVQLDPTPAVVATAPDVLADFSSRGPTADANLKPDVTAPGVNIVAAGYGPDPNPLAGFGQVSGTSMAAPHVAGAAAIIRQLRPDWTPAQVKSALMTTAAPTVRALDGSLAPPLGRGAGRIDVARAVDASLFASPPSLSLGEHRAGADVSATTRLTGVGPAVPFLASARLHDDRPGASVSVTPERMTLSPNVATDLRLTIRLAPDAPPGDYQGDVILTAPDSTDSHRIPFFVRVAPERDRSVLLISNDGSGLSRDLPNTAGLYRRALDALQVPYDLFDPEEPRVDRRGMPPLSALQRYRVVILFTGARDSPNVGNQISVSQADQDILADYLNGGGRLLVLGRDIASALDTNFAFQDPLFGRSRLFHGYLGSVVRGRTRAPATLTGAPGSPLAGTSYSLTATGDLPALDAYREDSDTYLAPQTTRPLLVAGEAIVGIYRVSEPTAAEPRREFAYRTIGLSVGLESVAERDHAPLLGALLRWLLETAP